MKTVSNTSPIIFLSKVSRLELLEELFGTILIPQEVFEELKMPILPPWIKMQSVHWKDFGNIGTGESAALALAMEKHAVLLIDDHRGKVIAKSFNVATLGTIGIILLALEKKIIFSSECKNIITSLVSTHGLYLSTDLFAEIIGKL